MKKRLFLSLFAFVLVIAMVLPMASCTTNTGTPNTTTAATTTGGTTAGNTTAGSTTEGTTAGNGDSTTAATTTGGDIGGSTGGTTEEIDWSKITIEKIEGDFTYEDAVTVLSSNWNPHTYQTTDESYPVSFITTGLYGFFYNDEFLYKSSIGAAAYEGYVIAPEMAAELPIDITEQVKAEHPEFNIPSDATKGYAYTIKLNPNAVWENGAPINADTYVYSMQQLLNPDLKNYRGPDYFSGSLCIANAEPYYYQGSSAYLDNGVTNGFALADLTLGEDGIYYAPNGNMMHIGVDFPLDWLGDTLKYYVDKYGVNYFSVEYWQNLVDMMDENGLVPMTEETYAWLVDVIAGNPAWGETAANAPSYFVEEKYYQDDYSYDNVGCYKTGEYEIVLVLGKSLAGFQLLYNLSGNWIVYKDMYEASKTQVGETDAWTTTYNSSLESTMSYGPYKMTSFQMDKEMTFERNDTWFGYTDNKHVYLDPEDGKYYSMYQTTKIHCQVVKEPSTRKTMFLAGQLMGYGLQSDDFTEYRDSDYAYVTPSETIFFFIFNGYKDAIEKRENNEDFDKTKNDLQTLTILNFRKAIAVTYDKDALCAEISPARSGGYGLIGSSYIYDPETGARYRDTDQAKKALCEFYGIDYTAAPYNGDLDAAVDSITGYDPVQAKALFAEAYAEAIELGYITDTDNDGKSDQTIRIEYASSETSAFIQKTLEYLNQKLAEVLVGTPFEGKIEFYESAPLANAWSDNIKNGLSDTVLAGWSGSALDPFGLTDLYTNPEKQYDAKWFNSSAVTFELEVNTAKIGEEPVMKTLTMTLKQWSDALNGTTVEVDGVQYNFGDGIADVNTRLDILAKCETVILTTYDYIPMLQDGSIALLSKQVYYVVEDYNPIMGRGGIAYMKYNYDDVEWAAYIAEQGGTLTY